MKKFYAVFAILFASAILSAQNIYTVAGTGSAGYGGDNGLATSAEISNISGNVAMDAAGNLYIPDYDNQRIRKVDAATGIITTVAGTGTNGYNGDGILAVNAQLNYPQAVAVDGAGNLYIAEYNGRRVREVSAATGLISTIAGTGAYGYNGDSLLAINSMLTEVSGIALDANGNIYFSDMGNSFIRKIDISNGHLYIVAGTGMQGYNGDNIPAITAQLNVPMGIAMDNSGNLLVAEFQGNRIRKINVTSGLISTVSGNGVQGYNGDGIPATTAEINNPWSIASDALGNFYISDNYNSRIRKVNNSGIISTVAGTGNYGFTGDGGLADSTELEYPRGIFVDPCGNLYISEYGSGRIRKVTSYNINLTKTDVTCHGGCNGTVSVAASGGNGPYTYSWTGGLGTGASHTNVCAGTYTVTSTDASGCSENLTVTVAEPPVLSLVILQTNTACSMSTGRAIGVASGGTMPYTYLWSNSVANDTASNLQAGNYSLTVTDTNGCTVTQSVSIISDPTPPATVPICMVTVDQASQHNIVVWDKTLFPHVDSFIVYREIATNNYQPIGAVPYDSLSEFIDTVRTLYFPNTGDPNAGTYRYKIKANDSCGHYSLFSPYHNTIYMNNNNGTFTWPQLYTIEGGPNPVSSYVLLRDNLSNGNWTPVSSVAGTQQTITDPSYSTYQATASWRVQTVWSITCVPSRINPNATLSLNASYSNIFSNNVSGIDQHSLSSSVSIFPNPNNGMFSVNVSTVSGGMRIEIYNSLGEIVQTKNIVSENTSIDISNEASGIYFYRIISSDGMVSSGKLIRE